MAGVAVWFTGLPGAGKSSLARSVARVLEARGEDVVHLEMDARRKAYFPNPTYTAEEREAAYGRFVAEATDLLRQGRTVLLDATANRRAYRDLARRKAAALGARFVEVQLTVPVETAMEREAARPEGKVMADLYAKALKRAATGEEVPGLGQVPGVDVAYEENPEAELTLDAAELTLGELTVAVLDMLTFR